MHKTQCLIIGGGPAGLSAAIYAARAGLETQIVGCDPKVAGDYDIDNYFGFEATITGKELITRGRRQAAKFGTQIDCEKVLGVHHGEAGGFVVKTDVREFEACAVILATGVARSKPNIPDLAAFEGKGVSYCVSCDGYFYKGKPVVVAGEGLFAANQALELLAYTPNVRICTLGKAPSYPPDIARKLDEAGIAVLQSKITSLTGELDLSGLAGLKRIGLSDGTTLEAHGLFIALGEASSTDFAYTLGVERNGNFIQVDREMCTNIPGVFAAGDCTGGFLQISVAVGEGALAARSAIAHVKSTCPKARPVQTEG